MRPQLGFSHPSLSVALLTPTRHWFMLRHALPPEPMLILPGPLFPIVLPFTLPCNQIVCIQGMAYLLRSKPVWFFSVLTLIPLALYGWKNTKAPTTGRMCSTGAWNYPQHQHNPMHWNFVAPWFLCTEILSPSDSYVLKFCTLSDSNALKFCPPLDQKNKICLQHRYKVYIWI